MGRGLSKAEFMAAWKLHKFGFSNTRIAAELKDIQKKNAPAKAATLASAETKLFTDVV